MNTRKPVVLLAPLDWGLGHTVRCIPIVKELLLAGCEVIVACNSKQKLLLTKEFPSIKYVPLEGYNIYYGKNRLKTIFNLFLQGPKLLTKINLEHNWLREFLINNSVNAVIADNRYGLFSADIPCILMTHQLRVKSGMGSIIDGLVQKVLYYYISKFTECWVPDWENPILNAGGELSHPRKIPRLPIKYLGCFSRFQKCVQSIHTNQILIILSGPEPQRTILEKKMIDQLKTYEGVGVLVRGVFDKSTIPSFKNITVLNNASALDLNKLICSCEIIISRAGYTSIMDILKLEKKCILIPTPGQAEQEYLASYLHKKKHAFSISQGKFCLQTILKSVREFPFIGISGFTDQYQATVKDFANRVNQTFDQSSFLDFGKSKK